MSSFFQPSYWLTLSAPEVGGVLGTLVFAVFVVSFVLGLVGRIVVDRKSTDRYKRDIGSRIAGLLMTMGILGAVLFFFSFERIQLFGARFWYPVWALATVVWVAFIVRYALRDIPAKKAHAQRLHAQSKYLPRSGRR